MKPLFFILILFTLLLFPGIAQEDRILFLVSPETEKAVHSVLSNASARCGWQSVFRNIDQESDSVVEPSGSDDEPSEVSDSQTFPRTISVSLESDSRNFGGKVLVTLSLTLEEMDEGSAQSSRIMESVGIGRTQDEAFEESLSQLDLLFTKYLSGNYTAETSLVHLARVSNGEFILVTPQETYQRNDRFQLLDKVNGTSLGVMRVKSVTKDYTVLQSLNFGINESSHYSMEPLKKTGLETHFYYGLYGRPPFFSSKNDFPFASPSFGILQSFQPRGWPIAPYVELDFPLSKLVSLPFSVSTGILYPIYLGNLRFFPAAGIGIYQDFDPFPVSDPLTGIFIGLSFGADYLIGDFFRPGLLIKYQYYTELDGSQNWFSFFTGLQITFEY